MKKRIALAFLCALHMSSAIPNMNLVENIRKRGAKQFKTNESHCSTLFGGNGSWSHQNGESPEFNTASHTLLSVDSIGRGEAIDGLHKSNIQWIVLVGDSNTRKLFYNMIPYICASIRVECSYLTPFATDDQTKKRGEDRIFKPVEIYKSNVTVERIINGKTLIGQYTYPDMDLIVQSATKPAVRISYRMNNADSSRVKKTLDDLSALHCISSVSQLCEVPYRPRIPAELEAMKYPNAIFFSEGLWGWNTYFESARDNIDRIFGRFYHLRKYSRIVWLNLYDIRWEVLMEGPYHQFVKFSNKYGLDISKGVVRKVNGLRQREAAANNIPVLNIYSVAEDLYSLYKSLHGSDDKDLTILRTWLSPDGYHQSPLVLTVVTRLIFDILCSCVN